MSPFRFFVSQTALFAVCIGLFPVTVSAHPHSWITMTTEVTGDDKQLTGFNMTWTFDAMTTAYLFDGEDMSKSHRTATLHKLALSVINNMLSTHYFTYFYDKKTPIRYKRVYKGVLTTHHGKATLKFRLPLAKPYPYNGRKLDLRIFDPTYYVDMSWPGLKNIVVSEQVKSHCQYKIVEPHPTPAQVSYAMSIPIDGKQDDTLGQLFTQTLELVCQP